MQEAKPSATPECAGPGTRLGQGEDITLASLFDILRATDLTIRLEPRIIDRKTLLQTRYTPEVFDELARAYLSTGAGIAGMQPKIMVPDRVTLPVPTIIVKAVAPSYPGLSANEFMCLTAAGHTGIETPTFDLLDDGQLLLVDRFGMRQTNRASVSRTSRR